MTRSFLFVLIFCCIGNVTPAQTLDITVLTIEEYLGYVKKYHPIVRQANLLIDEGQAKLMKARGAFDPKLEVDYERKKIKSIEYYDKLNASFKVPTWYGIELIANFEENTGVFLNPEANLPENGLYTVGVSIPLAKGLLINRRMASLKQAKLFRDQTKAERQLLVNKILSEASMAYFNWIKAFRDQNVYLNFLDNAKIRLDGIKRSYESGESPAIDTLEAGIILNNRKLALEKARINLVKSRLELSNWLWLDNNIPVELNESVQPNLQTYNTIDMVLKTSPLAVENADIGNHPKIRVLNLKYEGQKIERRLNLSNLLPQVNLEYNFLTQSPEAINSLNTANYKTGLSINFPIFLRKERSNLKLADLKLNATDLEISETRLALTNKFNALTTEAVSYERQLELTNTIVDDYTRLLNAEDRKFQLGDSSIFLVNSRESKLIEAKLKAYETENQYFRVKASLFELINVSD